MEQSNQLVNVKLSEFVIEIVFFLIQIFDYQTFEDHNLLYFEYVPAFFTSVF